MLHHNVIFLVYSQIGGVHFSKDEIMALALACMHGMAMMCREECPIMVNIYRFWDFWVVVQGHIASVRRGRFGASSFSPLTGLNGARCNLILYRGHIKQSRTYFCIYQLGIWDPNLSVRLLLALNPKCSLWALPSCIFNYRCNSGVFSLPNTITLVFCTLYQDNIFGFTLSSPKMCSKNKFEHTGEFPIMELRMHNNRKSITYAQESTLVSFCMFPSLSMWMVTLSPRIIQASCMHDHPITWAYPRKREHCDGQPINTVDPINADCSFCHRTKHPVNLDQFVYIS